MKGAVLPDGTIVVVGNKHADMLDFEKTLIHEAVGHYGIERVIRQRRTVNLITKIDAQNGRLSVAGQRNGIIDERVKESVSKDKSDGELTPQQEKMIAVGK
jgi:hypothetical protein